MSGKVEIFGMTDVGRDREHNEDNFAICQDLQLQEWRFQKGQEVKLGQLGALLVVADGMGGTNAGEVASDIAQKTVRGIFSTLTQTLPQNIHAFLKDAILQAHQDIADHAKANPECQGMGTTLIISWIIGNQMHVAWSGDSRCYVHIKQVGRDHSMVADLVESGQITEEQAWDHPDSNIITQSLGDTYHRPKPDAITHTLVTGDRVVVCSDGLNGMLRDQQIAQILSEGMPTAETCRKLVEQANFAGGHDNITVLMLDAKQLPLTANQANAQVGQDMTKSQMSRVMSQKNLIITVLGVVLLAFMGFEAYKWLSEDEPEPEDKEITIGSNSGNREPDLGKGDNPADSSQQETPQATPEEGEVQSPNKGSGKGSGNSATSPPTTSPGQGEVQDQQPPAPDASNPQSPNLTEDTVKNGGQQGGGINPIKEKPEDQGDSLLPSGGNANKLTPLIPTKAELKVEIKEVIEIKATARRKLNCIAEYAKKDEVAAAKKQIERSDAILREMYGLVKFQNNKVTSLPQTKADKNTLNNKIPEWKEAYRDMNGEADKIIEQVEKSSSRKYGKVQECLK